jgi:hypothetical protein
MSAQLCPEPFHNAVNEMGGKFFAIYGDFGLDPLVHAVTGKKTAKEFNETRIF